MAVRRLAHGDGVEETILESAAARVSILNLGCALRDWRVAHGGRERGVVLGFADPRAYRDNPHFLGVVVGRVANRIAYGRFPLGGRTVRLGCNQPPHHLHGGARGLGTRLWTLETDAAATAVRLSYRSPDGEEGYPGAIAFEIDVRLDGRRLVWDMRGAPDRPTPVNLAQHAYYDLTDGAGARAHRLRVAARAFTPADAGGIPTGDIAPVAGARCDFTAARTLAEADPHAFGFDVNLVLDPDRPADAPAAEAAAPDGLTLRLWTDRPGLQLYDSTHMDRVEGGHGGAAYERFAGLCLEAQGFPDSPNQPAFPSILHDPDRPYRQRLEVEIG